MYVFFFPLYIIICYLSIPVLPICIRADRLYIYSRQHYISLPLMLLFLYLSLCLYIASFYVLSDHFLLFSRQRSLSDTRCVLELQGYKVYFLVLLSFVLCSLILLSLSFYVCIPFSPQYDYLLSIYPCSAYLY